MADPRKKQELAGASVRSLVAARRMTNVDDRRQQIIDHTLTLYKSKGMDAVSYVDIAEACGVSRRLIQHYFPQPSDLRMDAVKQIRDDFQKFCLDAVAKHSKARDQLVAYVGATCEWVDRNPAEARVWLLYFYYCGVDVRYRKLHTELLKRANVRLQEMLKLGETQGDFEASTDPGMRAKLSQNTIAGILLMEVTENRWPNSGEIRKRTVELCLTLARAKPARRER